MATEVLAPPKPKAYDETFFRPITLWLTTTDHKLIGIMYMTTGFLSFLIGGVVALIMRIQLARLNLLGFWLIPFSVIAYYAAFFVGGGGLNAGWTASPPLNSKQFNPGHGVD